jgi:N-acetylneuraminic acid mutarotase
MIEGTRKFLTSVFVLALVFSTCVIPFFWVEKVNAQEGGSWTTLAPLPTSLYRPQGAVAVDGKIYLLGRHINMKYDPETNTWTTLTPYPISNSYGTVVACQNKIYLIGGIAEVPTQVYDPVTDTWENRTSISTTRAGLQANVVDGKIYVISGQIPSFPSVIETSSANDVYDPATDSWSEMAAIPVPVMGYASAVLDNKIYIIGGGNAEAAYSPINQVQIFEPKTNQWTNGSQIPTGVVYTRACVTTGLSYPKRIYVIGGTTNYYFGEGYAGRASVNLNQVYDPVTDTWSTGTPMPTSRCGLKVAVVNDELYAIGGSNGDGDVYANEKYIPSSYIPEFPSWIMLPLFLVATLFVMVFKKRLIHIRRYST